MSLVGLAIGAVGALGVGGVAALASGALPAVIGAAGRILGGLVSTSAGLTIAVGLTCGIGAYTYGYFHGRGIEAARWQAANAAAETARQKRDADIEAKTAGKFQPVIDDLLKKASDYAKANPGTGSCRLTDDELRRLRNVGR